MTTARVLLVHSDPAVVELTSRALERIGVAADVVARGAEVEAVDYDVMLLDLSVADELPERIRKDGVRPIVIVTASPRDAEQLDPDSVSLVVPTPYDGAMVAGVILACVSESGASVPLLAMPRGEGTEAV